MSANKIKQKILKSLFNHYQEGERRSGFGHQVTDLGKSLSNLEIHRNTGLKLETVDDFCFALTNSKHIQVVREDNDNKAHRYLITSWGRETVINNYFPNQDKKDKWNIAKDILLVVTAVGTFLFAIFTSIQNKTYEQQIKDLRIKIEKLQKK